MYTRNGLFVRKYPFRGGLLKPFSTGLANIFYFEDGDNPTPPPPVYVSGLEPTAAPENSDLHRTGTPTATGTVVESVISLITY
jgi:hypothetical protein